jgi:putative ABC transport system substrate-binding protein
MQFDQLNRRDFITLLGGMAVAWPRVARGQQGERMRRIGVLMNLAADDKEGQARLIAFVQALSDLGWKNTSNVQIETCWGAGDTGRFHQCAAELVALAPDVILAASASTMDPLLNQTRSIPIVFAQVPDPVGSGYVTSLARPGGNVTGFTQFDFSIASSPPGRRSDSYGKCPCGSAPRPHNRACGSIQVTCDLPVPLFRP